MSKSAYPLKMPNSVTVAAARLAKADGVSLNQFIAVAAAEKVVAMETAAEFLKQ
jgi:predicted HicB family RNase H-like nuclease